MRTSKRNPNITLKSAHRALMDMISRREHSEAELKEKLLKKEFIYLQELLTN